MRGGSYANPLPFLRCTARGYGYEQMSAPRVGFRVARKANEGAAKSGAPKNGNFLHW
jgi:hypothetical protein